MKVKNDHRSKFSNLSNWKEEAWKNQGFNDIRTRDLRVTGALLYQLSYEATHWERGQFIEFISPMRSEKMWSIHEIINFWIVLVNGDKNSYKGELLQTVKSGLEPIRQASNSSALALKSMINVNTKNKLNANLSTTLKSVLLVLVNIIIITKILTWLWRFLVIFLYGFLWAHASLWELQDNNKGHEKFAVLTSKPQSHVRINF